MRDPAGAVDDQVGLDHVLVAGCVEGHPVGRSDGLNGGDGCLRPHVDVDIGSSGDQQVHEVRVETFEGTDAAVDDDGAGAGSSGDVGELERHEPAADEEHPPGPVLSIRCSAPGK